MLISTRASLEMPAEFAPAGDSIAGAPTKASRDVQRVRIEPQQPRAASPVASPALGAAGRCDPAGAAARCTQGEKQLHLHHGASST
jgi:hypothetical protein